VRVIIEGRDAHITRPVQKLFPIEVHARPNAGNKTRQKSSATNRFVREQSAS